MKTKNILLIFFLLVTQAVVAQIMFQRHYGGVENDGGSSVLQTDDGGYLIAGHTESYGAGGRDIYLIKTDENGDTLWTRTYGGIGDDQASILLSSNGNKYLIVGETSSFGNGSCDVYAVKIQNNGDTIWTKTYGGVDEDCGFGGVQSNDTIALIVGSTMSYSPVFNSIYVIKINVNRDTLWENMYYKNTANYGFDIIETNLNEYLITGSTSNVGNNTSRDCFIIKTDNDGDTIWTKTYGGTDDDQAFSACLTNDNCYIISGTTKSYGQGGFDIFLMKLNADGDELWMKTYGGIADDWGGTVQKTIDSGFIITGYTESYGAGGWDVYLIKTDANGDTLWTRTFGGAGDEWGSSVKQTSDNGYIISGYTNSYGGNYDAFLIKTNELGIIGFQKIYKSQKYCKVFPNPNNGVFNIEIDNTENKDLMVSIFDISGRLVYSKNGLFGQNKTARIEILNAPNGFYIVNIQSNNLLINKKIIIKK
jgi:hypothetical protein